VPIPKEYKEIIEMLNTATQDGRVRWKQTKGANVAILVPPSEFEIWAGTDDNTERGFVAFGIREGHTLVDNWYLDEGDVNYELMSELYQRAKREAFGVSKRLQGIKDLLAKKGPVGE